MSWLGKAIKDILGNPNTPEPSNLLGPESEKEAEEMIQIVHDPEGDDWNHFLPKTNPPAAEPETPGEINAVQPEKKSILGKLLGW